MKKVLKILENIIFSFLILIALLIVVSLLPIKNNYKIYVVMSGSMEPKIKTGSLIFSQPVNDYQVDDIITFKSENSNTKDTTTHRIIEKNVENDEVEYTTKGDANNSNDQETVNKEQIVGKYVWGVPFLGYLIGYIQTLPGLILIVVIPATIIIYEEARKIKVEGKNIIEKRKTIKKEKSKKNKRKDNDGK